MSKLTIVVVTTRRIAGRALSAWLVLSALLFTPLLATDPADRWQSLALMQKDGSQAKKDASKEIGARDSARQQQSKSSAQQWPEKAEEAELLSFVEQHQPPLAKLLRHMRGRRPMQYQQALREVMRTHKRLENLMRRDAELHALELELWTTKGKLRLLAAEMVATESGSTQELKVKLAKLVRLEAELELRKLELSRSRLVAQLAELDERIEQRKSSQPQIVEKAVKSWESRIRKQKSALE